MKKPRIKLELAVYGQNINPEEFSTVSQLNYTSSLMTRKKKIDGQVVEWQEVIWEYATEYISTFELEEVVAGVVDILKEHENAIEKYIKRNNLECRFGFVVEMAQNIEPGLYLSKSTISLIAKMNGDIDVDLYCLDEEQL